MKNVSGRTGNFENGRFALAVRTSSINGRGLFADAPLPGRRKLGELSGKLVALPQAWRDAEGNPKIYLVQVSERRALDCSAGNDFRFINHCCEPNCYLRIFNRRVEVYTLKPIRKGQELTVDYGETPHRAGMRCGCGATSCRGIL